MPSEDRPAHLTLENLRQIGRYEAPGGTVFRYDGWRRAWVVTRPEGKARSGSMPLPERRRVTDRSVGSQPVLPPWRLRSGFMSESQRA